MKKTLATLIKLQKTYVDEQRLILIKLQEHLEKIEGAITELEIRRAREQIAVQENPTISVTYGDFLRWAIDHAHELEEQRLVAVKAVELARDKLAELFEEQKRYEIAEQHRLAEELKEEIRQERIELDEVGSVTFERRMRERG